jgi:flagellar M-ring protein FliF
MGSHTSLVWSEASFAARAGLVALALALVALTAGAAYWVLRDDYQPLFADLDPRDAAAIADELERMKVPYRAADGGRSLMVDGDAVHLTRLKVMGRGIDLKGTVGFEIFNNTDFGMTEFAQRINYQRALQGELARTIGALEEIQSARVHLVLPESGLFKRNAVRPKASVTLAVHGGRGLLPEQIHGIQRLIAAAVPEMDPAAVTVLDHQGVALSRRAEPESDAPAAYARLESKRDAEAHLTRKVAAILDRALGPGQAIVSVDVSLRHEQVKTTREDVVKAPGGAVARRRDSAQGEGTGRGSTREIEYVHGRKVEQVVSGPGAVRRISVALLLPPHVTTGQAEGLKRIVAMAVGLDARRGDAIAVSHSAAAVAPEVVSAPVPVVAAPVTRARPLPQASVPQAAWAALAGALAALAALFLYAARRRAALVAAPPPLSVAQREELLGRVRVWVEDASRSA